MPREFFWIIQIREIKLYLEKKKKRKKSDSANEIVKHMI